MKNHTWYIEDTQVIDLLKSNGFTCEHPQAKQTGEFFKNWHDTDCPIEWNRQYVLPDRHIIASSGTSLTLTK